MDYEINTATQSSTLSSDSDDDPEPQSKRGRPSIPFEEASQRTKLKKTDEAVEFLEKQCDDLKVDYNFLLLFLLKRHAATNGDNEAMNYFNGLLKEGIPNEPNIVDPEKGFYIK